MARSLYRSLEEVCRQDLLDKISIRYLLATSLYEVSVQDLYKRSLGKISERGLWARSQKISMQCLCAKSLYETSVQAF